ncbi:hypothetical protein CAPTEDRAFT_214902 [Capitella teleta]|uniref:Uncharacterized protein n=1 Tax=Capitella teleta TaxID=283909 RepID=R7UKN0_CAPTE|nr:hypothetical protein CAPTEDRAFT_214902 [Capitella teleta]|eukprot:ELU07064.1 hypothetical protein CAPTEDRAFT_214902 [Capitella teleta]
MLVNKDSELGRAQLTLEFTETPGDVYERVGGSAVMIWNYDLVGSDLLAIFFEHLAKNGQINRILDVDADGNVSPSPDFPHASFTPRATLTLDPLRDSDEGEVICNIYTTDGGPVRDSASVTIVAADDQKDVKITLMDSANEVVCGPQTFIDFDETITIEVPVESDSGAPMEAKAFKKCGEGQENQIGSECTKGSGVCTFETSAGCDGFTGGLVTIRGTVKHPAFDEAKEDTCSYTVQGPNFIPLQQSPVCEAQVSTDPEQERERRLVATNACPGVNSLQGTLRLTLAIIGVNINNENGNKHSI